MFYFSFKTFKYNTIFSKLKMSTRLLPLAAMEKILKQCGADRVSDKAKVALKNVVEELADEISQKAIKLANHAGRKTVKARDVKLAAKS